MDSAPPRQAHLTGAPDPRSTLLPRVADGAAHASKNVRQRRPEPRVTRESRGAHGACPDMETSPCSEVTLARRLH